jgi:hypothetical protein
MARSISPHEQVPVRVGPAFLSQRPQDCNCISAPSRGSIGHLPGCSRRRDQPGKSGRSELHQGEASFTPRTLALAAGLRQHRGADDVSRR